MGVFIRMGSMGAIFVAMIILFVIGIGANGIRTTNYRFGTTIENQETYWDDIHGIRTIVLFNANFAPLAGILCTGYFLHTCSLPIMRSAKYPENNTRNLFASYLLVFLSYAIVGGFGYVGFLGTFFRNYFVRILYQTRTGQINQNCLNMFAGESVLAFVARVALFFLLFASYPLFNLYLRTHLLNIFWQGKEAETKHLLVLNLVITAIPLTLALLY